MKQLCSKQAVNCGRQYEIDFLKAFPIVFMVIIHVYENLSKGLYDPCPSTPLEHILQILAGPFAAPAFMFAMGVGIIYSTHNSPKRLFIRGFQFFLGGYLLNAARSGIFTLIISAASGTWDLENIQYVFFNGDIFHFAGLALMLSAGFLKCNVPGYGIGAAALIMQGIGYLCSRGPEMTGGFEYIAGLFYKCTPSCCFPLLQWYLFPAAGIIYGTALRHVTDRSAWYKRIFCLSVPMLIIYMVVLAAAGYNLTQLYTLENDAFYNQNLLTSVFALLIIGIEIAVSHAAAERIKGTRGMNYITHVAKNLFNIFVIQWILIGIMYSIRLGYELELIPLEWVVPTGLLIVLATGLILECMLKLSAYRLS